MCGELILDFGFYSFHGGKLPNEEYNTLICEAENYVANVTNNRSVCPPPIMEERVKICICRIIDAMHEANRLDKEIPKGVTSVSNDGYSITRASSGSMAEREQEYNAICRRYLLNPINLMYLGV